MFAQTFFIVWRESIEALLVIGILHAWLRHNTTTGGTLRYLWGGVLAGLGAALGLSLLLTRLNTMLPPEGQDYFQILMIFTACTLILQMVFWMRRHSKGLKHQLEQGLSTRLENGQLWGVFTLALIAVMREGTETVIFLQGFIAAGRGNGGEIATGIVSALAVASATYALLQLGGRYLSWRLFFRLTETMLLFLACALLVSGSGYLISLGVLPYTDPLWDTSFLIDDLTRLGGIVAGLTGYRAVPDVVTVMVWLVYWGTILWALQAQKRRLGGARAK